MKFPAFAYHRPETLEEALHLLADEDARPLAGGQSLLPMMALRLAAPTMLIDLSEIAALRQSDIGMDRARIGAMVTHADNAASFDIWARLPLMSEALHHVAHPAVRTRGTFGGSLAHADAGAEMPLVLTALGGHVLLRSLAGDRRLAAEDFFLGHYTTAIAQGELLVGAEMPVSPLLWAFEEVSRRAGDLALAMVASGVRIEDGRCREVCIAASGVSDRPLRLTEAASALIDRPLDERTIAEAGRIAAASITPRSDIHASADHRRALVDVLVRRTLTRLAQGDC